ncbi:MAG: hypothetical protein ABSD20_03825 [Terriglobales bacterium]
MRCERCQHDNPADHLFCGFCGVALVAQPAVPAARPATGDAAEIEPFPGFDGLSTGGPSPAKVRRTNVIQRSEMLRPDAEPAEGGSLSIQEFAEPKRTAPVDGSSFHIYRHPQLSPETPDEDDAEPDSLLGSPESLEEDRNLDYLLKEEPARDYWRFLVVLLIAAVLGGFIVYKWRQSSKAPDSGMTSQTSPAEAAENLPASPAPPDAAPSASSIAPSKAPDTAHAAGDAKNGPTETSTQPGPQDTVTGRNHKTAAIQQTEIPMPGVQTPKPANRASSSIDTSDKLLAQGQASLYGNNVPRDCNQALKLIRNAADLGNARARSLLGALYATGHCVPLDRAQAYDWYSLAAGSSKEKDVWVQRNREMLWNEMTPDERARAKQDSPN